MSWKGFFSFIFFLLVVVLLTFYWILPVGDVAEFGVSNPGHSNFTLNQTLEGDMQFYDNMRYRSPNISYKIEDCSIVKTDEMLRAINIIEESTILNFYEVSNNEEISISCEESSVRGEKGAFVAGEGGVTKVTSSGEFSVIFNGKVLLLRETQCADPIVGIHELLHALGFEHSDNPNNMMYPTVKCRQTIGEDMLNYIDLIYSIPQNADLAIENASASIQGRYLDLSLTIKNNGLENADESLLIISSRDKEVKEFEVEEIQIGSGRILTLTNIALPITERNTEEIEVVLNYDGNELDKENNRVILKLKNSE